MPGSDKSAKSAKPAEAAPHYLGHRERLRERFLQGGSDALQDYEMLELILFRAIPRRDVKPLAKELLKKFGSLAEVIAAPGERLKEVGGLGDSAITDLKILHAAAKELLRGAVQKRQCSRHGRACSTTAAPPWALKARSTFASCFSTRPTISSPTSSTRPAPSTIPPSTRAKWSSARSSSPPPRSSWCTTIPPAIRRPRAPIST